MTIPVHLTQVYHKDPDPGTTVWTSDIDTFGLTSDRSVLDWIITLPCTRTQSSSIRTRPYLA